MDKNILDTLDAYQLGKELQIARSRKGMTQEEAAKVIDVARTTITAIEKGERRIKATELIRLAQAYGRQVSDFVRPRPIVEPFQVQFRGPNLALFKETPEISSYVHTLEDFCRDYLELEQLTQSPLPTKYPTEYSISRQKAEQAAEGIALEERARLGLGDNPLPALRDILEQEVGLRIFYFPMLSKFSAMYFYTEQLGGCIAINNSHVWERRRWSLAHEYAHFLAQRNQPTIEEDYVRQPESERFADSFAQYFLMPTAGVTRRFNKTFQTKGDFTLSDLLLLADYYKVSLEAMTRRLEDLKLVHTGMWDKLKSSNLKIRVLQQEQGLEQIPAQEAQIPVRYQYLAFEALNKGLISEGQFAQFLRISRLEGVHLANLLREGEIINMGEDPASYNHTLARLGGK